MSIALDTTQTVWDASDHTFAEVWTNSITIGSGANRILVAMVNTTGDIPTAVSLDGTTALTMVTGSNITDGTGSNSSLWYLINPPSGSHTITVTSGQQNGTAILSSWTGVNQTTPFGTLVENTVVTAASDTLSVTGTTGSVLLDFMAQVWNDTQADPAAGQTRLGDVDAGGSLGPSAKVNASYKAATSGSMTMAPSSGGISGPHIGIALMPATGGAANPFYYQQSQGWI